MSWKGAGRPNQPASNPPWAQRPTGGGIKPTGGIRPTQPGVRPQQPSTKPPGSTGSIKPVISPFGSVASAVKTEKAAPAPSVVAIKAKIAKLNSECTTMETQAKATIEAAKKVIENEKATPMVLKSTLEKIEAQVTKIAAFQTPITKEREDARRAGPAASACITDLSKLLEKSQKLRQESTMMISKLRPKVSKATSEASNKEKEAKDSATFKPILAKITKEVSVAEEAVSAVAKKADPVVSSKPEGEELDKMTTSIETAAAEAAKKVQAARKELQEKQAGINTYAPEAKKTAHAAFSELSKKLAECGKKVGLYQAFKKELPKIIASKEALAQITELLDGHDKALTNASKLAEMSKIDKEKVDAIDSHLEPVQKAIKESGGLIQAKMRMADAATQASLSELKKKGDDMTKKIQAVYTKIKKQRDVIRAAEFVEQAEGKLQSAEEGWTQCQDAEMPFLTGVEVLPGEQNDIALKESDDAISKSSAAVNEAKTFVKKCLADAKTMEKELGEKVTSEMTPFLDKIDAIGANVSKFRKETAERKVTSILTVVLDALEELEKKASSLEDDAIALGRPGLEDESEEEIASAIEKAKASNTELQAKLAETKKLAAEKQREAKAPQNDPTAISINSRLKAGQDKLGKFNASIHAAEKVLKAKSAVKAGEEKVTQAEADVEKVKQFTTFTADSVKEFEKSFGVAFASVKTAGSTLQPALAHAPGKVKEALQALLDRKSEAQKALDKVKSDTKEAREEALVEAYLAAVEASVKEAESVAETMDEAEKPFVVGGDLPLEETQATLKKCEGAANATKEAAGEAGRLIEQKIRDVKPFGETVAKKAKDGFAAASDRVKTVKTKLTTFEKELRDRSKAARMTDASAKVDQVEAALKKTVEAAEPFTKEGGADISEADAEAPLKAFMEADKALGALVATTRSALSARMGEQKDSKDNMELVKKLQERLSKASQELATVKKATKKHEQRASGKLMLAEATEQVGTLDAIVKKATDACAPLLEKGGKEFLIDHSVQTLVAALQFHLKEKELTQESLLKELSSMDEKAFVAYLEKLAETTGRDELNAFSAERRSEIFASVSKDGFKGMFKQTWTCTKPVAITNKFESEGSETVVRLMPGTEVELFGVRKEDDAGLLRSECTSGEHKGWVTIRQKKGGTFLSSMTALSKFYRTMDNEISEANKALQKISSSIAEKSKSAPGDEPALKEARAEIAKLKEKLAEPNKAMNELHKKVSAAKQEYANTEKAESNAHIKARNMKEAAPYIEGPQSKLEVILGMANDAENAASSLVSLSGDELLAFATPGSVSDVVEKANASVAEKVAEIKETIKEQNKVVSEVTPQTGGTGEAKSQLRQIQSKVEETSRKTSKLLATVKSKCAAIVNPKLEATSAAIRKYAQKEGLSGEALFDKFKDDDKITETSFCKLIESLESAPVASEVAKLIFQKLGKDGINKDAFLGYVVVYYKVTKTIAFTDVMDITTCKTLRKAPIGEVLEMLEDPVKDETHGVTRIKAKSLKEPIVEGWVTFSGNQGSEFLEKTKKP